MAFAPKGSRPKPDDTKRDASKALDDNRMPAIIAAAPNPPRERVSRKAPLPRGLSQTKPPAVRVKTAEVPSSISVRAKATIKRKPDPVAKPRNPPAQPKPVRTASKPALPPKINPKETQVAPDALTISAQLAPWLYMRLSLEGTLEQLETETEEILNSERQRLLEAEKQVEESQLKAEFREQTELLEDLCNDENSEFSLGLSAITKEISSFMSQSSNSSSNPNLSTTLEVLQDKVYSNEPESGELSDTLDAAIQQVQAVKRRLDDFRTSFVAGKWSLKHPSKWKATLERYTSLLDSRIRNLQLLRGAVISVAAYRKQRMELEIINAAIS